MINSSPNNLLQMLFHVSYFNDKYLDPAIGNIFFSQKYTYTFPTTYKPKTPHPRVGETSTEKRNI